MEIGITISLIGLCISCVAIGISLASVMYTKRNKR